MDLIKSSEDLLEFNRPGSSTLLIKLIYLTKKYNNLNDMIESFCKNYPDEVNRLCRNRCNPLYFTIYCIDNCIEIVKILLNNGAIINTMYDDCHCLDVALYYDDLELIKLLLDRGADQNRYTQRNIGSFSNYLVKARILLEYDSNNFKDEEIAKKIDLMNTKN